MILVYKLKHPFPRRRVVARELAGSKGAKKEKSGAEEKVRGKSSGRKA